MAAVSVLAEMAVPNQAIERTAIRRVFTFQMTKTRSLQVTLAVGGRRSSCSR